MRAMASSASTRARRRADPDRLRVDGRESRNDPPDRVLDRDHRNMSSMRVRATRASFSATSFGMPRVLPVRKA